MRKAHLEISLNPQVLYWARQRAGLDINTLAKKMVIKPERIKDWEKTGQITFSQVDKLAHHTHTPVGYLYLPKPVNDSLPISDFRTVGDKPLSNPSPDLLETVQSMQRRQAWMHDELIETGHTKLPFIGSVNIEDDPKRIATLIKTDLGLEPNWASNESTWTDALRTLRDTIESVGVLIVFNGIVGNNTHRKLSTEEFRGFALIDDYAPLIFINSTDFKGAQIFTLLHELVHIWIGKDGVSNFDAFQPSPNAIEIFCNKVAAEFLVSEQDLLEIWSDAPEGNERYNFLARRFKVSNIVVARRSLDLNLISRELFFEFYNSWRIDARHTKNSPGGDFWNNQNVRVGKKFGAAVVRAVKEGRLLYRDAYSLTGLSGVTFNTFANTLGY